MGADKQVASRRVTDCSAIVSSWIRKDSILALEFSSITDAARDIIYKYENGWAISTVARLFHMHNTRIKEHLLKNNVPIRARRYRNLQNSRVGWDESFSVDTPSSLYWAGFLMADGSIVKLKGESAVRCDISCKDEKHVIALSKFVGRGEPKRSKNRQYELIKWRVYSRRIADDLARWGILPRKGQTEDATPKGSARTSVDFWRGIIDGDGSITKSGKTPQVRLVSRRGITEAYVEFLENELSRKIYKRKDRLRIFDYGKNGATRVIVDSANAIRVCRLLYLNVPDKLYLPRMREVALRMISEWSD